ncbi:disease resistance protein RPM1-like isoform X5 [Quercus robur]|uniref:disease resistance protein RPM1-like isoform X5 n=1 Tax=Quercus robur TaxID=38942 RepID=UPI00216185A4|nr:disease resistance protein RPM1-like isoform X5 [Quercus robur]
MDQAVVELLIENIISILSNEASLLWGARDAIEDIKDELISMQSFLVDADRKGVGREGEKTWVANVRDWAYDVEDIIDEYMYHINHQQIGGQSSWNLHHTINFPKNLWVRRQTATKIQKINEKIKGAIPERKQRYGIDHIEGTSSKDNQKWVVRHAESSLFFKEDELVGSRIILTTRKEDVACYHLGGKHHIHHIQLLQNEEAWELFCNKAFINCTNGSCPLELKSSAEELVRKCDGLPLAIAALGSLMYSKNMSDWNEIYNSLNWSLSKNPKLEAVKSILLLSFNDLPYQLKHCFLYCSLFPEDHEIRRKRLIKLWMAEGFVEQDKRSMPEEVAESYLLELIFRSMLQVVKRNANGRPKRCKLHDILRELALSISEREKIGVVHVGREEMTECEARRISIHKTDGEVKSFTSMPKLRSFLVFNKMLKTLPFGSKMLRVLYLEDAPIDDLPDELFKLFNLRYLNLRGTLVKELPKSVGRLQNLQTLDIRDTKLEVLPCEIGELQNLRHLILHQYTGNWNDFKFVSGPRTPSNICRLKNLQVVTYLEIKCDLLKQIRSMTLLTTIVLSNVKAADEVDLCDSIHNMKLMRYLCMDALSSPPTNLQKLVLVGKLEKVPQWFHSLQSLTYLYLHWSRLEEDLLPHIAALPHLGHLSLFYVYVGKQLCFSTGFLKLTRLSISNFPQLNEIIIEKGVMPNLKTLQIDSCMELKTVPKGIEYLKNLQQLYLESVSMELQNSIEGEGSVHFPKVRQIPNIRIW